MNGMRSIMQGIARISVLINPEIPNKKLNVGIFNEFMGSLPQIPILRTIKKQNLVTPEINKDYETGSLITERGALDIKPTKDFYFGEYLNSGY